ncbi:glycosyltransferase family 39 protein [bacterium]|nr:glycosyltransferase family 39 protein [bacterium]
MNQNKEADSHSPIWILLSLLTVLYLFGSNIIPLIPPDEPRYSQVARQMFESGDWITPRLGNYPWFEKPVLLYWLMCISFAIFGVTEFAVRFPSAISALICVYLTYNVVRKASEETTALLCAAILGTSAFFVAFSHAATFDMLLTVCVAASLWSFFEFDAPSGKKLHLFAAYAFCGLGILAKGFVAPAVIALTAGVYWFTEHRFRDLNKLHLIKGILLVVLVAGVWLVPVTLIHRSLFWDDFFLQHHLARYTTAKLHRAESVFFFVPIVLLGMYPWTAGMFCGFRDGRTDQERKLLRFSLIWFISSFIFFSLSRSKLPGYILPLAPPLAVIAGFSLLGAWKHAKKVRIIVTFSIIHILVAGGIIFLLKDFHIPHESFSEIASVIVIIATFSALFFYHQQFWRAVITQATVLLIGMLILLYAIYPATDFNETRTLCKAVDSELDSNHKIAVYNIYDFSFVFYTNARVELDEKGYFIDLKNVTELYRYLKNKDRGYIIAYNEDLVWMRRTEFLKILQVISGPKRSIAVLTVRK